MADDAALEAHELTDPLNVIEHFAAQWEGLAMLAPKLRAWQPLLDDEERVAGRPGGHPGPGRKPGTKGGGPCPEIVAREAKLVELREAITAAEANHANISAAIEAVRAHFALHKFE